ncbi:MAG: class I mannose-6-phosphate isomerase [Sandaracinobacteroides sp.]
MAIAGTGIQKLVARPISKPWGQARPPAGLAAALGHLWTADIGQLGELWFEPESGPAPALLLKLLFTSERLSVQVHPGAEHAAARGLKGGKDEAWHVLAADADARIGLGLAHAGPGEDLRAASESGRIVDLMEWVRVAAGDVVYVPGGTVHALGGGLVLAEIQENVDVTWRLHDYGRHRPLHLDQGLAVASLAPRPEVVPQPAVAGAGRQIRCAGGRFVLETWLGGMSGTLAPAPERPLWLLPIDGYLDVQGVRATPGEALLVEACAAGASFRLEGTALAAYPGSDPLEGLLQVSEPLSPVAVAA